MADRSSTQCGDGQLLFGTGIFNQLHDSAPNITLTLWRPFGLRPHSASLGRSVALPAAPPISKLHHPLSSKHLKISLIC